MATFVSGIVRTPLVFLSALGQADLSFDIYDYVYGTVDG